MVTVGAGRDSRLIRRPLDLEPYAKATHLDSFEAESKRTWFTVRDTIRAATRRGRLWIPAVVTPVEGSVRIFTSEEAVEIRPRRLRWIASNSFVVAGIGKDAKIRRSYLRFKTPEEASRAATIIKQNSAILEEPLVPVQEFPVQVRLLLSAGYVALQLSGMIVRLIVGLFILAIFFSLGTFGLTVGILVFVSYLGPPLWIAFVRARRTTQGWVRFQRGSIVVRGQEWTPIVPRVIEWRSSKVIVLRGPGRSYELSFPTTQDLTLAVTRIRTAFPQVQETLSKTYQQGVDPTHA